MVTIHMCLLLSSPSYQAAKLMSHQNIANLLNPYQDQDEEVFELLHLCVPFLVLGIWLEVERL